MVICVSLHISLIRDGIYKVLNFCEMPTPHTGVALAEKILSLLCEWGIEQRIFSLTVDNASSNDICVIMLKSQLRLRNALVTWSVMKIFFLFDVVLILLI